MLLIKYPLYCYTKPVTLSTPKKLKDLMYTCKKKINVALIVIFHIIIHLTQLSGMGDDAERISFALEKITIIDDIIHYCEQCQTYCSHIMHFFYPHVLKDEPNPLEFMLNSIDNLSVNPTHFETQSAPILSLRDIADLTKCVKNTLTMDISLKLPPKSLDKLLHPEHGIYLQALVIPNNAQIVTIGDLHGEVHALAQIIRSLQCKNLMDQYGTLSPRTYLVFLGDLVDRGSYSIETLALALLLKKQNPDHVIIIRGNHEQLKPMTKYGTIQECITKYGNINAITIIKNLITLFDLLPPACFIGTQSNNQKIQFLQFNHGGLPYSFNYDTQNTYQQEPLFVYGITEPIDTFIKILLQRCALNTCNNTTFFYCSSDLPKNNGFLWSDFVNHDQIYTSSDHRSMGVVASSQAFNAYTQKINTPNSVLLCGIIRGHQHMRHGINQFHTIDTFSLTPENPNGWLPLESEITIPCTQQHAGLPIFTITSRPNAYNCNAYALVHYNDATQTWMLTPHIMQDTL